MPWNSPNSYRFAADAITTHAPAGSGVYGLYSAQQWIYIGESHDIRSRLLQHLRGDNECITRLNPASFVFELAPVHQLVARQIALIREFRPVCNQRSG